MDEKYIIDELRAIKDRITDVEIKLSKFYDAKHEESISRVNDTENALCEESENTATAINDLENAVCELSEQIDNM